MSGLPEGWEATTLGDVTHQRGEKINPQDQPELPFIGMDDVEGHTGRLLGQQRTGDFKSSVAHFQLGDILYGRLRPYLNKVWEAEFEGTASAEFIVMPRAAAITQAYLQKMLMGPDFIDFTGLVSTGDRPRVSFQSMAGFEFPLPPLAEQKRIVAKLDRLSARSGKAKTHLAEVQTLATRAKQATLAAAFRGELTAEWRASQPDLESAAQLVDRIPEPKQSRGGREATDNVKEGVGAISVNNPGSDLPDGWAWVKLRRIARQETGHTPSRSRPEWWGGDVNWIGIKDANAHHGREINETIQKTNEDGLANSSARLLPKGTVCLSRTASVGYVTIMGREMATSQDFATWTCSEALLPRYLMWGLMSEGEKIRDFGEGTTHTTIYFPEVRAFHIKLCSLSEQTEIVRRIETAFAKIDRMVEEASRAADLLDRLDQQLLAKAFRGELVPQDPSDEPASALLARIREARANAPKPKRRRKTAKA